MNVQLCTSSIYDMINLLKMKREHILTHKDIEDLLNHDDYQFEFKRYHYRIQIHEFINYFMNFENLEITDIENEDLRIHHSYWIDFYNSLNSYEENIKNFFLNFNEEIVNEAYLIAKNGFPNNYIFDHFKIVMTCGIGQSFGYPFEDAIHFDILQLIKKYNNNEFKYTIAHEIHHLIFNRNIKLEKNDIEGYFIQCFAGEGLAIHFTNNAPGVLTNKFDIEKQSNLGIDHESMKYLNNQFYSTYKEFKKTIYMIRNKEIKTIDEINDLIFEYWLDCHTDEQCHDDIPHLKQSRLYSLGNELWGIIYDVYGMHRVYEIVNHPILFIDSFNEALHILKQEKLRI